MIVAGGLHAKVVVYPIAEGSSAASRLTNWAVLVKTGEGGKLFGAITSADLHQKLTDAGVVIEKKKIHLHTPIKTLGKHEVKIKLHAEVSVEVSFDVVSENPIVEAGAAEAPKKEIDPYAEHTKMAQNAARAAEKAAKRSRK